MLTCRSRYEADLSVYVVSFISSTMVLDAINKFTKRNYLVNGHYLYRGTLY